MNLLYPIYFYSEHGGRNSSEILVISVGIILAQRMREGCPCCLKQDREWGITPITTPMDATKVHSITFQKSINLRSDGLRTSNFTFFYPEEADGIFNFALEYAIKKVQEDQVGLKLNGTH
jgi:hypothetical protein